jgi:mono/diheme cytochrome c family protein
MQRFRLLGFYLIGVVGVVGLAVGGVSLRRATADEPQSPGVGEAHGLPTTASTGTEGANLASAVRTIFSAKCIECHGSDLVRPKGKFGYVLDLERLAGNARLVVPFKPDESKLWQLVRDEEMPPEYARAGSLTREQKEVIRKWIEAGSPAVPPG